jgi:hypothetical protein
MKSRRCIASPKAQDHAYWGSIGWQLQQGWAIDEMGFGGQFAQQQSRASHVRFGSKADMPL